MAEARIGIQDALWSNVAGSFNGAGGVGGVDCGFFNRTGFVIDVTATTAIRVRTGNSGISVVVSDGVPGRLYNDPQQAPAVARLTDIGAANAIATTEVAAGLDPAKRYNLYVCGYFNSALPLADTVIIDGPVAPQFLPPFGAAPGEDWVAAGIADMIAAGHVKTFGLCRLYNTGFPDTPALHMGCGSKFRIRTKGEKLLLAWNAFVGANDIDIAFSVSRDGVPIIDADAEPSRSKGGRQFLGQGQNVNPTTSAPMFGLINLWPEGAPDGLFHTYEFTFTQVYGPTTDLTFLLGVGWINGDIDGADQAPDFDPATRVVIAFGDSITVGNATWGYFGTDRAGIEVNYPIHAVRQASALLGQPLEIGVAATGGAVMAHVGAAGGQARASQHFSNFVVNLMQGNYGVIAAYTGCYGANEFKNGYVLGSNPALEQDFEDKWVDHLASCESLTPGVPFVMLSLHGGGSLPAIDDPVNAMVVGRLLSAAQRHLVAFPNADVKIRLIGGEQKGVAGIPDHPLIEEGPTFYTGAENGNALHPAYWGAPFSPTNPRPGSTYEGVAPYRDLVLEMLGYTPDATPPGLTVGPIAADGVTVPITTSEPTTGTLGFGFTIAGGNRPALVTRQSPTELTATLSSPAYQGQAPTTYSYDPLAGDVEDLSGNEAAAAAGVAVVNNSEVQAPVAPQITQQPQAASAVVGETETFTGAASGTPSPALQWQTQAPGGGAWANVPGATSGALEYGPVALADDGRKFRLVATNASGTATSNEATLTVTPAPAVTSVTVTPEAPTVAGGGTQQFSAAVVAVGGASTAVTWDVLSGPGTISAGGLYTAPAATEAPQTATIRARSVFDPTKLDTATVTIPAQAGGGGGGDDVDFRFVWTGADEISADSTEYVSVKVFATRNGAARTASEYPVSVSFGAETPGGDRVYHAMEYVSDDEAQLLVGVGTAVELAPGSYEVHVRAEAGDEREARRLPRLFVVR